MPRHIATLLALLTLLAPGPGLAQSASPSETQLQLERRQRRVIVRPSTPPAAVEDDVDTATAEIEQRRREEATTRSLTRPSPRRPDLDYDVKSGIQSQRLNDALR